MAEPSTPDGVSPLVPEDKTVEDLTSTSQQLENSSEPPPADDVNTGNGSLQEVSASENGAAVEESTEDIQLKPTVAGEPDLKTKADKQEGMLKKPPATTSANRSAKPSNPTTPGTAPVSKSGSLGTSVKKVLSSGTFGGGQTKPTTGPKTSSSLSSSANKPPPTPTKKNSSTTSLAKPATATTKTSITTSTSVASRRTSMAPPATKSLSSSTNSRPLSTISTKAPPVLATTRTSVTSTAAVSDPLRSSSGPGASRPRASVSDGVPAKKPGAPRPSLSASRTTPTPGIRPLRTAGSASISSIKEVKEDSKVIQELEMKYKDAASSLEVNLERVKELEAQVETTKTSLASTEAERDTKQQALESLQATKASLETELAVARDGLDSQKKAGDAQLLQLKEELQTAQDSTATQTNFITTLQEQVKAVEAELASAKEAIAMTRSSNEIAIAEAGRIDRDQLLKAQADLEVVKTETDALAAAHTKAQEAAAERIQALESELEKALGVSTELEQLKNVKEEVESKLSEVEVEILEQREAVEKATDERDKALARLKLLEEELAAAKAASAATAEASRLKEEEHGAVLEKLKGLEARLAMVQESYESAQADLRAKEEAHTQKMAEINRLHEEKSKTVAEEMQRIKVDLEGQEAKYASHLDEVKAEHASLLEQAFQKAKSEAGSEHAVELQNLRVQSQATIEQLRQVHQTSLDEAQASHQNALENQVSGLEKQIGNLQLELKATQDDLAKAKAGLEAALALEGTLRTQIEQKDSEFAATKLLVDQSEEVARLTKELANTKDDLLNLTEAFNVSKESFQQISGNHTLELEEAAKHRAEEVTRLRETHEEEASAFKRERDALASQISELEVELMTLKATAEAQPPTASMSLRKDTNGAIPGSSVVTKEELQRMHEAHNLKVYELESSHEQTIKELTEKLEAATVHAEEQNTLAERLQMEINFAEQSAEENEDELKQLRDEVDHLKVQLQLAGAGP